MTTVLIKGTIASHTKGLSIVYDSKLNMYNCRTKRNLLNPGQDINSIAVGDDVKVSYNKDTKLGIITSVMPRKTIFQRQLKHKNSAQVIATNVDLLAIVTSIVNPEILIGLIARFLLSAGLGLIKSIIIINKSDLVSKQELNHYLEFFEDSLIDVFSHSIYDKQSKEKIEKYFSKKHVLLVGASGVGKSSLINHLIPGSMIKTDQLIANINKGKHTTTLTKTYFSPKKYKIIDTPGVQEHTPFTSNYKTIANYYLPFKKIGINCKFSNCQHIDEPNCSIKNFVLTNQNLEKWYKEYKNIQASLIQSNKEKSQ